jgi:hypothetical protein
VDEAATVRAGIRNKAHQSSPPTVNAGLATRYPPCTRTHRCDRNPHFPSGKYTK